MPEDELFRSMDRRAFLRSSVLLGSLAALGPLHALGARIRQGEKLLVGKGYGPLVNKGDLWLPKDFNYQIVSTQGQPMSDGAATPGIFDGMGAFRAPRKNGREPHRTILIRNHENRELDGEIRPLTGAEREYDPFTHGGNTKLVIERRKMGRKDPLCGEELYHYRVVEDFAILGGTSTNCAGGELPFKRWVTCEEVVKRSPNGKKHGYVFEIDSLAEGPVTAVPVRGAGRMSHEAVAWRNGILYLTEDRSLDFDSRLGRIGACFYRYIPGKRLKRSRKLADCGWGVLQALKIRGEIHADMDSAREIGFPFPVEWVTVDDPDHEDDSDNRRDRWPGFIPTRIQAQDKGAAFFDRLEGAWAIGAGPNARIYFDCTVGGPAKLGQVWEYHPAKSTLTLIYQSTNPETLRHPDNMTVVPRTKDILLCEDGGGVQFIRGLTTKGEIYDFAKTGTNFTEFCGACFDPAGHTLYVNQQGDRGALPEGPAGARAVTYAIYGPFGRRS